MTPIKTENQIIEVKTIDSLVKTKVRSKKQSLRSLKKWSLTVFATTLLIASLFVLNAFAKSQINQNSAVLNLTNTTRTSQGLKSLSENEQLSAAAKAKAQDMFRYQYFDHNSPQGKTPWDFINNAGYDYAYAGENLAIDFNNIKDTQNAWMKSPTHKANILNGHYKEMGSASVTGQFKGKITTITVEMFGTSMFDTVLNNLHTRW